MVRQLLEDGWEIDPEDLSRISPYLAEHINRFGEYSTHELGIQPRRTTWNLTSTSPHSATRTWPPLASARPPEQAAAGRVTNSRTSITEPMCPACGGA
jgi:hypothetical protein